MNYIYGDIIKLTKDGTFDVVVHGCNCFCNMGKGLAKNIKEAFPDAYIADCKTRPGDSQKLGNFTCAHVSTKKRNVLVVNAYTQYRFGNKKRLYTDYEAMRRVFARISEVFKGKYIAYPKIGAGLGGGDWDIISTIIENTLIGCEHVCVTRDKDALWI